MRWLTGFVFIPDKVIIVTKEMPENEILGAKD
jgi:hypothetical protein